MTTQLSKTEVVNDNNEVVISYLTTEEKVEALQSLGEEWFSSIKTEKDIYLQRGRILREIVNEELYKLKLDKETGVYKEIENREFEDFLKEDSKEFFKRHKNLTFESAKNYQAFYLLCDRMLSHKNFCPPVIMHQITPMTHLKKYGKVRWLVKVIRNILLMMMLKTHLLFMGQKFKQNKELITHLKENMNKLDLKI
jgi:hypothetical protein